MVETSTLPAQATAHGTASSNSLAARSVPNAAPAPAQRPVGIDARKHRRARAHWPVRLITSTGKVACGWVCDVSEGGVGLMSSVNMPVGSMVEIALAIPSLKDPTRSVPLRCRVRVVFSAFVGVQSRLGVQFTTLPMESRMAIRHYVIANS